MALPEIVVRRGDTLSLGCLWTSGPGTSGDPIDLTGYTARAQMRTSASAAVYAELDVDIDPGTAGTFVLGATAAATAEWAPGSYVCDIEFTSAGGEVYSRGPWIMRVTADFTRD
jgi:hypothetical protein